MNKIKTLIVDDEPLARDNIKILLKNDPEIEISGECRNGSEAINRLTNANIDLLFLDIQMPGFNGFEVLSKIKAANTPVIIFTTAFDNFALEAFKVNAIDYLLKPFTDQQFYNSLKKGKDHCKLKDFQNFNKQLLSFLESYKEFSDENNQVIKYLTKIAIDVTGKTLLVKTDDIDWIEAADYYLQIHTGKSCHLIRESMNELEKKLDPAKFMRIHRSTIINLDRLKEINPLFNGECIAVLYDGTKLKISRSRKETIKSKFRIPG
jgi:two-component system, LytTR family, response regulator